MLINKLDVYKDSSLLQKFIIDRAHWLGFGIGWGRLGVKD